LLPRDLIFSIIVGNREKASPFFGTRISNPNRYLRIAASAETTRPAQKWATVGVLLPHAIIEAVNATAE